MDLMYHTINEMHIDIVLGQEPNKKLARNQKNKLFCDKKCDSFIYTRSNMAVLKYIACNGFVYVELESVVIYSCYVSPNITISEFENYLYEIKTSMGLQKKPVIIGGDFNSTPTINGKVAKGERGRIFDEWLSSCALTVANCGNVPTFCGPQGSSIVDVTLITEYKEEHISDWVTHENMENMSDHRNITFTLNCKKVDNYVATSITGWKQNEKLWIKFLDKYKEGMFTQEAKEAIQTAEMLEDSLKEICNQNFPIKKSPTHNRRPVYWWNQNIAKIRKQCIKQRRRLTRMNSTNKDELTKNEAKKKYKQLKKQLNKAIINSKRENWKQLCNDLDTDIWGQAFKIINKKLNNEIRIQLTKEEVEKQIHALFPNGKHQVYKMEVCPRPNPFTMQELMIAANKMKNKKSPGPDNLTPEFIKAAVKLNPEVFLQVFNNNLANGTFPKSWKKAKLVLIKKPKKNNNDEDTYRPICLLNTTAKLLERMICNRLNEELEEKEVLHRCQFGFRKHRSTLDALNEVLNIVKIIKTKNCRHQGLSILITLDIKNAFNSAPWGKIIEALQRTKVSTYLINLIKSYLCDREIAAEGGVSATVTRGVPQGSILGPVLWNVFYDDILRVDVGPGVDLVAYADDLAVVVRAMDPENLKQRSEHAIRQLNWKLEEMEIRLAPEKTEIVILVGRRKFSNIKLNIGGTIVENKKTVKYMGIHIAKDAALTHHLKKACTAAVEKLNTLQRVMPHIGGPKTKKRRILTSAITSKLMYAAPIWAPVLRFQKYKNMLESVNRRIALKIIGGYKTISTTAAIAISGTLPLVDRVEEAKYVYEKGAGSKKEARVDTKKRWQEKWERYNGWAKTFIKDVNMWSELKHGEVDFYVTQAISGHGTFGAYLEKIGKKENSMCWFCDAQIDDPDHTIFKCPRWRREREEAYNKCQCEINNANIAELLLKSTETWGAVTEMLKKIMMKKAEYELSLTSND